MRSLAPLHRRFLLIFIFCLIGVVLYSSSNKSLLRLPHVSSERDHIWLIATISAARSQRRRNIIRATWQASYQHPAIMTRFVISHPGNHWMPLIQHENATHGDIIMLPHLNETAQVANTVKSIEFFKFLASCGNSWEFVSKIDDDSYLDTREFFEEFIKPLLENPQPKRTMIGRRLYHHNPDYEYAGGQFYTMSWDLISVFAQVYESDPILNEHEDVLNGALLHKAGASFNFVSLDNSKAFDYDNEQDDEYAWAHRIGEGAINPHKMKDDDTYLMVAEIFRHREHKSSVTYY
ncbi:hypothetical protein BO82DRAFT_208384 [Aspergillus uvarum CBS 121591]|uniref:Hexosyltransferase n=1 Tax=Aspergillus uvarum CBS 121591 TaxID=1448315 RepID=A0A319BXJ9_9EURO|nr:hypothetical protein BO82DRAFT_208384 [Aspergillus uvarum CBS 121591]PYH76279.1 hypothetical protein BO82DRAFT_208384 [Aspergillus uvarum CBS 121591]